MNMLATRINKFFRISTIGEERLEKIKRTAVASDRDLVDSGRWKAMSDMPVIRTLDVPSYQPSPAKARQRCA